MTLLPTQTTSHQPRPWVRALLPFHITSEKGREVGFFFFKAFLRPVCVPELSLHFQRSFLSWNSLGVSREESCPRCGLQFNHRKRRTAPVPLFFFQEVTLSELLFFFLYGLLLRSSLKGSYHTASVLECTF